MDGAVVLSGDGTRIVRAAVHLMPDPSIPTEESGTRHRTAERVSKQSGFPVVSVSQSMHIIGALRGRPAARPGRLGRILSRANQALATLERTSSASTRSPARSPPWRSRIWSPSATPWPWCSAWRWSAGSPTRSPATWSRSAPTAACSTPTRRVDRRRRRRPHPRQSATTCRPAARPGRSTRRWSSSTCSPPASSSTSSRWPRRSATRARRRRSTPRCSPRGFRLLAKVPRLPGAIVDRLVDHFGSLQRLLGATVDDLQAVDGVGRRAGRGSRGLSRLAEASILERYV